MDTFLRPKAWGEADASPAGHFWRHTLDQKASHQAQEDCRSDKLCNNSHPGKRKPAQVTPESGQKMMVPFVHFALDVQVLHNYIGCGAMHYLCNP